MEKLLNKLKKFLCLVKFQSTQTKQFFIPKFEKKTWDVTDYHP
jgi:hypothetical protein